MIKRLVLSKIAFSLLAGMLALKVFPQSGAVFGPYLPQLMRWPTFLYLATLPLATFAAFQPRLGWGRGIVVLVWGESLALTAAGGAVGMALTFPAARYFAAQLGQFFPVFNVSGATLLMDLPAIVVVGAAASVVPSWRAARVNVVEGFRHLG